MENSKPLQEIRLVYGLGAYADRDIDITLVSEYGDLRLSRMDAPAALPAGSTLKGLIGGQEEIRERVTFRDFAPTWRQGGECWQNGQFVGHKAL